MRPGLTSVIVVAANSGPGLLDCVRRALDSDTPVELLISDNASRDGSVDALRRQWAGDARVRILDNGANLGFGAGANRAAAQAQGDALVILNPDCYVDPPTFAAVRRVASAHANAGIVGVRIVDALGNDEPASIRRDPTLRRSLMTLTGLSRRESESARYEGVNAVVDSARANATFEVEAISGAFMYLPRRAFDAVGGFDEGYFLHCEDLDLCRRLRDSGHRVLYAGEIRLEHGKGGSSHGRPVFVAWHKHRGMWRWFRRFDPAARNPLVAVLVGVGLWARFAAQLPRLILRRWARS
ncbi:glycosyltransferase [Tahibacter amnicola]|uniref:Glycosyltransferase family 2 protein n=1 Tax=Tahibacter amnicola TaxID=2976241 RepID=A0ABY6BCK7_9GAMM|nr:glycosyltransferase family 2 protein [Tahibacter amnicola]UXI67773.1 glycosyltransferase family 2 protein [Tahibacter amnicola]